MALPSDVNCPDRPPAHAAKHVVSGAYADHLSLTEVAIGESWPRCDLGGGTGERGPEQVERAAGPRLRREVQTRAAACVNGSSVARGKGSWECRRWGRGGPGIRDSSSPPQHCEKGHVALNQIDRDGADYVEPENARADAHEIPGFWTATSACQRASLEGRVPSPMCRRSGAASGLSQCVTDAIAPRQCLEETDQRLLGPRWQRAMVGFAHQLVAIGNCPPASHSTPVSRGGGLRLSAVRTRWLGEGTHLRWGANTLVTAPDQALDGRVRS